MSQQMVDFFECKTLNAKRKTMVAGVQISENNLFYRKIYL